jgi:hypothetical protein
MQLSTEALVEAIERAGASAGTDERALGAVIYPLVEAHGVDAVVAELRANRADPLFASALAYAVQFSDLSLADVFSADEIVAAALDFLLMVHTPGWGESRESRVIDELRHGHWAWSALFDHQPGQRNHLDDDEHFQLVLALIARAPSRNEILWMIGDGPLAHAAGDEARFAEIQERAKSDPKLALTWRLNEVDWPHGSL